MQDRPTYCLTLRPEKDETDPAGIRRLRMALKTLLRAYRLRTVRIEEVKPPTPQTLEQDDHDT